MTQQSTDSIQEGHFNFKDDEGGFVCLLILCCWPQNMEPKPVYEWPVRWVSWLFFLAPEKSLGLA